MEKLIDLCKNFDWNSLRFQILGNRKKTTFILTGTVVIIYTANT
jgi:hypothetical protein